MAVSGAIRLMAGAVALLVSGSALAQTAPAKGVAAPAIIVIVDAARVQRESTAGKGLAAERERYQQTYNTEFETARKQLQAAEQDLAKQRSSLAPDVFQEKVRTLNARIAEFQRQYQGAVRALDKSTATASNDLQKAVVGVTSEVASEAGAGLVLHKQQVFLHDERMDITAQVIERLNKRLSSIPFPVPEAHVPTVEETAPKGKK
ncbi:OmpH family outer membrane protein [Magnetospirillum sp. 64-120]|uniref:OmpH family outer membrane protein n=1 Tax=Magnetospirillum sp. 64-120 TaxID=1895778 RepID=UPI00092609FA|nr:OmpH family outer membrane protein [Magnetospirillum sp. 64-120]OJX81003.1 MAG: hypothetical protein BGO92_07925 [Magnetospirillum sp. 64-120]